MSTTKIWWSLIWRMKIVLAISILILTLIQDVLPQDDYLLQLKRLIIDTICTCFFLNSYWFKSISPLKRVFGERLGWPDEAWELTAKLYSIYFTTLVCINIVIWIFYTHDTYRLFTLVHMPVPILFTWYVAWRENILLSQ